MTGASDKQAYRELLDYLYTLRPFGTKLGLERIRALLDRLGSPDHQLRFLHIAGTNGKGSTAAMLDAILRRAGLRTGLYTSPHLVDFTERIRVDGTPIQWHQALELAKIVRAQSRNLPAGEATFFEIVTAMAACCFAQQGCEAVIWETGMGGRLDATNAVQSTASVITTISYDHCQWLGNTLAMIAAEKAGIIKAGVPVFTSVVEDEPLRVIEKVSQERGAPLYLVCQADELPGKLAGNVIVYDAERYEPGRYALRIPALQLNQVKIGLCGAHQTRNAALAAVVGNWFLQAQTKPHNREHVRRGLAEVEWPGRFQILQKRPFVVVDCAHNANGMASLARTLSEFGREAWILVMSVMGDKDVEAMLREVQTVCRRVWYVRMRNERAMAEDVFRRAVTHALGGCTVERTFGDVGQLLQALREWQGRERFVITGSCYLVGEVLAAWRGGTRDARADDTVEIRAK
ncbi:MAG: bifunctional folylpolyglutamate synthase/dihydrofolate synthase [bacterium]|nr:bifunctional folylpolyglutamate synthase/dihydrofolate synthase [bacterium]